MPLSDRWGALRARYTETRPRRLLALDGGGIRGLITLGILSQLEAQLKPLAPDPEQFRLSHWFDYIGGTSTGAIIAAGLARGMCVGELIAFYREAGAEMFTKSHLLARLKSLYTADPLKARLQAAFGHNTTLQPEHLDCLLLVVTRNANTDSPWPISSNPDARYNHPARPDCNLRIPLWQLVRASTAAPVYFPPEVLHWDLGDPSKTFAFVDGAITPYNNPAFLMYRMATQSAYELRWPAGERHLLLVSVGTGAAPLVTEDPAHLRGDLVLAAAAVPGRLLYSVAVDQDIICRTVGRCSFGATIDSELRDLLCREEASPHAAGDDMNPAAVPLAHDLGRAFLYARYNADLSPRGLAALGLGGLPAHRVAKIDAVDQIDNLLAIGKAAGRDVELAHFGSFVDVPPLSPVAS